MSGFEYDNDAEGEWEERGDLAWNEYDWQQYLKSNEKDIARFLTFYQQLKHKQDHLDEIAHLMGWDREDWMPSDAFEDAEVSDTPAPEETLEFDAMEPYTVHKHPVFLVTRSLYQHLRFVWEHYLGNNPQWVTPALTWQFSGSLHAGELNAIMAINALDMGDFTLTICHLKNALSALNHTFSIIQQIPPRHQVKFSLFEKEACTALFDLREVWLRVMQDCREEHRRHRGD